MTRSELIARVAKRVAGRVPDEAPLPLTSAERGVARLFDEIGEALARGDRVELRGFGTFAVRHRAGRTGRNPRTGEPVAVTAKALPSFKTGKQLRERINAQSSE